MEPSYRQLAPWREYLNRINRKVDFPTLLFSIIIGMTIWFYVNSRRTVTREISVPITIETPEDWELQGVVPRSRLITIYGPAQLVQSLGISEISFAVKLNSQGNNRLGQSTRDVDLHLTPEMINGLPHDVDVTLIRDPDISLVLVRQTRRYIPVELSLTGELPAGFALKNYQISPQYVSVVAPEDSFQPGQTVKTQPLDLNDHKKSFVAYTDLLPLQLNDRMLAIADSIFVQFSIVETAAQKIIENVPVKILNVSTDKVASGVIEPTQVSVKIESNTTALNLTAPDQITVYVEAGEATPNGGEQSLKCRAFANDAIKVLEIIPAEVRWRPAN